MACDVLEEDPGGLDFPDDAGDMGPEVAGVIRSLPLSGRTEWLAGIPGEDGIESPSKRPAVECGEVIPYRGGGEVSGPLGSGDDGSRVFLPLDKASRVKAGLCEHEAHIKASAS